MTEDGNVAGRDFVGSVDGHVSPPSVRGRRSPPPTGKGGSGDIRKSAFVCQDGTLRLSCTAGKHIDVLRANFGRFSITLCNPSGTLDWSVNCASGNSLSVLTQRFVTAILHYYSDAANLLFALLAAIDARRRSICTTGTHTQTPPFLSLRTEN